MILPSIWCVNPAILWWRCLCFSPQTFFLRFMSCCFSFLLFALDTSSLCCLTHQPITWIYGLNPNDVLLPCPITCVLVLSLYVPLLWLLFSPPFVHFDYFIAPNVFTIMSAVSYCYSLTERHNHKEKPRDPLTGYFQKLYVDYLVLGSIFIQFIFFFFNFQTKTEEEVDFLVFIVELVDHWKSIDFFYIYIFFLLVSHFLAVWVERLLH